MSTTVTCAGNVIEDPELLYTCEGTPFVGWRVLVNHQVENDEGKWVNDEPAPHNVNLSGSAATHVHDSCGSGDPTCVQRPQRTASWPAKETGERCTKSVVVLDSGFGEVGISRRCVSARIECAAAQVG